MRERDGSFLPDLLSVPGETTSHPSVPSLETASAPLEPDAASLHSEREVGPSEAGLIEDDPPSRSAAATVEGAAISMPSPMRPRRAALPAAGGVEVFHSTPGNDMLGARRTSSSSLGGGGIAAISLL